MLLTRSREDIKKMLTHSREDSSQRTDCQVEQQDFSHSEGDVVCHQPVSHQHRKKNLITTVMPVDKT